MVPPNWNPCVGIKRAAGKVYRRYLTDEESARLGRTIDQLKDPHPAEVGAIRMLLVTGCRKQEILKLRCSDVTGRFMSLRDSKVEPRVVELGQAAQDVLKRTPQQPGNTFVFAGSRRRRAPITDLPIMAQCRAARCTHQIAAAP